MPCNIETKIDEQHWKKGEKSRHALLSEGNNSLHTHFFCAASLPVWPLPYPTPLSAHVRAVILRLKPSAAMSDRAEASDVLHLPHSTWPCPMPRSVSIPDPHTALVPLSLPLPLAIPLPLSCCPCALNLLRGEQRRETSMVSWLFLVACVLARQRQR